MQRGAALMPYGGPFLYETQGQTQIQGTAPELLLMCTCTVYYCSHKAVAKISSVFKWILLF